MTPLAQSIEAILFATAEPKTVKELSERLNAPKEEVAEALKVLQQSYEGHGIMLALHEETATLVSRPEQSSLLETIRKEELSKELTRASAETLAIVCYLGSTSKAEIEFIRGVNVSYTLRSLQMRGLVEAKGNGRAITYHPTLAVLEHFGISSIENLPQYQETRQKLQELMKRSEE